MKDIMDDQGEVFYESLDSSGSSNSSHITEEDLIDTFFHSCDLHNEGVVPASRIIEHLQFTVGDTAMGDEKIEQLQHLLDPLSADVYIDIHTYRSVVAQWIVNIRDIQSEDESAWQAQETDVPGNSQQDQRNRAISDGSVASVTPTVLVDCANPFSSFSRLGLDLDLKSLDIGELSNLVASLQYQNHKLGEEITTLRSQLETSEEMSSNMLQELENLRKSGKMYQNICEKNRNIVNDNEELKLTVAQLDETKRNLQSQIKTLSRDNHHLETQLFGLQEQLAKSSADLDIAKKDYDSLNAAYLDQKQLCLKAQLELEDAQIQLREKSSQMDELEENMKELRKIHEQMKFDKADLEMQLEENHKELVVTRGAPSDPSYDDVADDPDLLFHVSLDASDFVPSLQSELACSLRDSLGGLPTPVCDKELEDLISKMNSHQDTEKHDLNSDEIEAICQCVLTTKIVSDKMSEMMERFYAMQECILQVMAQFDGNAFGNCKDLRKLQLDVETFGEEMANIAKTKQDADFSIAMLSLVLGTSGGHPVTDYFKNIDDVVRCSGKTLFMLEKVQEVICQVRAEALFKSEVHLKLEYAEQKIREVTKETRMQNCVIIQLQHDKKQLELEVNGLKCSTTDLKEELKKSNDEMSGLRHEFTACHKQSVQDKEQLNNLQDQLTQNRLDHQVDLKELWRLVQKDVENECMSDSQDVSATASTESLRDQVAKEIYCLRTQLAKSQAALAALNKTLPLKVGWSDSVHDWKGSNKKSRKPSSPLVEALTLDFAAVEDGGGDADREAYKKQNRSADSILDGREDTCDDNGNFHGSSKYFTASCPHLSRSGVSSATQTDGGPYERRRPPQIGTNKHAIANTSTGSSTSGVVDLDVSSCSNKSEPQGITPKKSVLIVDAPCNTDDEGEGDPLLRHRTPSFKKAIERGPSAESSNSIELCDYMNTTPDLSPDRTEPPPYPYAGRDAFRGASSSDVSHQQHPDSGSLAFMQDLSHPDVDHSVTAIFKTSTPNASMEESDDLLNLDAQQLTDVKLSPHGGRRLSTLVEEGSDVESEDHHHHSAKSRLSTTYEMPFRQGQMPEMDLPAGPPPPYRPRTAPNYRCPPAYQQAVGRDAIRPPGERLPPPPYQRPVPPPKPQVHPQPNNQQVTFSNKPSATVTTITRPHYSTSPVQHQGGNLVDLVNGDLDEVEMSEADRQLNAQLLEEAKKASAASSRHKSRPRKNQSNDLAHSENVEDERDSALNKETNNNCQNQSNRSEPAAPALANHKSSQVLPPAAAKEPRQENGEAKLKSEMPAKTDGSKVETDSEQKPSASGCSGYKAMPQAHVAFPSLPNDTLESLGLLVNPGDNLEFAENLSEHELEEKFASLSLAFRTDRLTLEKRIDLQERARDNAENNINKELLGLKEALKALRTFCSDSASRDIYSKIEQHVNVLEQCSSRVSSRAECHGAVQQELRLSKAVEVMMQHVENLKMLYDKEHQELEETKKLLQENKAQQEGEITPGKRYSVAGLQAKPRSTQIQAGVSTIRKTSGQRISLSEKTEHAGGNPQ